VRPIHPPPLVRPERGASFVKPKFPCLASTPPPSHCPLAPEDAPTRRYKWNSCVAPFRDEPEGRGQCRRCRGLWMARGQRRRCPQPSHRPLGQPYGPTALQVAHTALENYDLRSEFSTLPDSPGCEYLFFLFRRVFSSLRSDFPAAPPGVATLDRNGWPPWIGMGGHLGPEWVATLDRNGWPLSPEYASASEATWITYFHAAGCSDE
jgi:hypothetical protein